MKRFAFSIWFLLAAGTLSCSGSCGGSDSSMDVDTDPVLVSMDGPQDIYWSEFVFLIDEMPESTRAKLVTLSSLTPRLDAMIENRVLAWNARRNGVDKEREVRKRLADFERSQLTGAYMQYLEDRYQSIKEPVTDEDVQAYYDEFIHHYTEGEQFAFNMISTVALKSWPKEQRETAREKMEEALALVRAGEDFAKVAEEYSSDGSAQRGGDIGYYSRTQMSSWMLRAFSQLDSIGDVSRIVEKDNGFAILKLRDRRTSYQRPLEEVRDDIIRRIERKRRTAFIEGEVQAAIDRCLVSTDKELVATLDLDDDSMDDKIFARVKSGDHIPVRDLRNEMNRRVAYQPVQTLDLKERHMVADQVIEQHCLGQAAKEQGLTDERATQNRLTLFRTQILAGSERNRLHNAVDFNPTDAELRRYYEKNKNAYVPRVINPDGTEGGFQPFEQVREQTYERMANQTRSKAVYDRIEELKREVNLIIHQDVLNERADSLLASISS